VKILVTGGAGYIGSVLVPMLLAEGHDVTGLDSFKYRPTSLLDCCHHKKLKIIRGCVKEIANLKLPWAAYDAVLPLACLTGAPACKDDPSGARAVNYDAIRYIADKLSPEQRLIFPSTNSGYGIGQEGIECDENTPLRPVSLYGQLKVDIEALLLDRGHCVTFRFATLFGTSPRMRLDLLVNDFTFRAVYDRFLVLFEPHFKRNYLHVRDAARAFVHTLAHYDRMKGRPYNVGLSDANLSKWELCESIRRVLKEQDERAEFYFEAAKIGEDPDKRNYIVSNARIEATGFKPAFSLEDGIRELIKGYRIVKHDQHTNA
jgi:nucleoside-diphosphate-sugar epimerase